MDRIGAHHVRISGDSGPTLMFAHGLGGHQGHWDPIVAALSQHARCITFPSPVHPTQTLRCSPPFGINRWQGLPMMLPCFAQHSA